LKGKNRKRQEIVGGKREKVEQAGDLSCRFLAIVDFEALFIIIYYAVKYDVYCKFQL
jgi:hypothetical protein